MVQTLPLALIGESMLIGKAAFDTLRLKNKTQFIALVLI